MNLRLGLLTVVLACLTLAAASAQGYQRAIGLRLGYPLAVSYKQYYSGSTAFEIYGGGSTYKDYSRFSITAALQKSYPLGLSNELSPLRWYWGGGASVQFWNYRDDFYRGKNRRGDYAATSAGINGYLGLEYAFREVPIMLTLDWVPVVFLGNGYRRGFRGESGGLGVRYILGR